MAPLSMALLRILLLSLVLKRAAAAMEATSAATASTVQPASCNKTCGVLEIPYPFGVGENCAMKQGTDDFNLTCDYTFSPPRLFWGDYEILDINPSKAELRVMGLASYRCYPENNTDGYLTIRLGLSSTFRFSDSQNIFVVLGCDTYALINGTEGVVYTGGCMSSCHSFKDVERMGRNCSGVGCCQINIPKGLNAMGVRLGSFNDHNYTVEFNPCDYAFLIEKGNFSFDASDLNNSKYKVTEPPIILDWSIGNQTCAEAEKNELGLALACRSSHSECFNSSSGIGYNCRCEDGYEGNPYLPGLGGCQEINECTRNLTICPGKNICTNTAGGYSCSCPQGYSTKGDPKTDGCDPNFEARSDPIPLLLKLGLGVGAALLLLLATISCLSWKFQREKFVEQTRKVKELKERLFEQNGGLILRDLLSSSRVAANTFILFTEEELAMATNGFDESQIAGRGGHGIVYIGRLADDTKVAIKKSRMVDERQSKEFAREIGILSQINHINVVRLLGCCLEVEIPILVYEYVACGTLYEFIHHAKYRAGPISLATRMRIATEAAEALAYLHSYASRPILHGDVKTSNILLDEQYRAKVSDFGASTLAPVDEVQLATVVQGTCGYLDPEYMQTYQLTTKSDVYSFGVVLAELLTGKKPVQLLGREDERGLAVSFVSSLRQNKLMQILDAKVVEDGEPEMLREISQLTCRCLSVKGDDRPTMKEVVMALYVLAERRPNEFPLWIRGMRDAPKETETEAETESLLGTNHLEMSTYERQHSRVDSNSEYLISLQGRPILTEIETGR